MKIDNYIWWGGEDLTKPAFFSSNRSKKYSSIFYKWSKSLSTSVSNNKFALLDLPVDNFRMVITAYIEKKGGTRGVFRYLGIILNKDEYKKLAALQCLYLSLNKLSIEYISQAVKNNIELDIDVKLLVEKTPIWTPVNELIHYEIIKPFPQNVKELSQKVSIENTDDWFNKLFIAINPYSYEDEFTTIASNDIPFGIWKKKRKLNIVTEHQENSTKPRKNVETKIINNNNLTYKQKKKTFPLKTITFSVLIIVLILLVIQNISKNNKIDKLENKIKNYESETYIISNQNSNKQKKIKKLKEQLEAKDAEIAKQTKTITDLNIKLKAKDDKIAEKAQKITDLNIKLKAKDAEIAEKAQKITDLNIKLKTKDAEIAEKAQKITDLNIKLKAKDTEIAKKAKTITGLNNKLEDRKKLLIRK